MTKNLLTIFLFIGLVSFGQTLSSNGASVKGTYTIQTGRTSQAVILKSFGLLSYNHITDEGKTYGRWTGKWRKSNDTIFFEYRNRCIRSSPMLYRDTCLVDLDDGKIYRKK